MLGQLFKHKIDNNLLVLLLETNCMKHNNHYIFNNDAFKKGLFNLSIQTFLTQLKPFYHISKQKYLERIQTYKSFTTILRQICNYINISYTSFIKYDKCKYETIYLIAILNDLD
jgi:hypothetical protein